MLTYKTILIDDEWPARMRLRQLLEIHPEIEIVAEAKNGIEAVELIDQLKPDLIFLDIRMPGLNGMEVIQQVQHMPYIIFCTAYEEYALQAFETNSIDYLVKPVRPDRLQKALDKLQNITKASSNNDLQALIAQMKQMHQPKEEATTLPVRKNQSILFIKICDIMYFKACDKYVELYTRKGEMYLTDNSLAHLEDKLPTYFKRIHRAHIINSSEILEIKKYLGGRYIFVLNDVSKSEVSSSRSFNQEIKASFLS